MIKSILETRMKEKKLSVRSAAKEIGIAHTTLTRMLVGGNFDLETVFKISEWVGMKPAELLGLETGDDVSLLVSAIPGLKEVLTEAVAKIRSGEIDISVLADITSFAKFRIREGQEKMREKTTK